jgi:hypothetical protein
MRSTFLLFSLLTLTLCSAPFASAQITNVTNDQSTPIPGAGHDYIKMLDETVNPANGSVSLRLHVPIPNGRGLSIPFAFAYDSNGVHHLAADGNGGSFWISDSSFLSQGGWSYSAPLLSFASLSVPYFYGGGSCGFTSEFVFQDPAGGRHSLGLSSTDNQTGNPCGLYPTTSAGDDLFRAATVDGNAINPPTSVAGIPEIHSTHDALN